MAKTSVLDAAIESAGDDTYAKVKGGGKVDRLLANLSAVGFDEHERLLDMLAEPVTTYSHVYMHGILSSLCNEYGIGMNGVSLANLSQWRAKLRTDRQAER